MDWSWTGVLVHALLYPVYQVLSTARHELAHAVAAWVSGLRVTEVRVIPGWRDGRFYWGWVRWEGTPNVHCYLAPYYVDLACLPFGVWLAVDPPGISFHVWAAAVVMLLISPAVDVAYNLVKWKLKERGDFAAALGREG